MVVNSQFSDGSGNLKRALSSRRAIIVSVMGGIGTGIFFSNIALISLAGPASMITWVIAWLLFAPLAVVIAELARVFPVSGSSTVAAAYSHGKIVGLIVGLANALWYIFIAGIEALAVVEGVDYYVPSLISSTGSPTVYGVILGVILLLIFIPINYFGMKSFSNITFFYGVIKWIWLAVVGFLFLLILMHGENFSNYGGSFPFGTQPLFLAVPTAMFGVGGARVISDFSEELHSTKQFLGIMFGNIIGQLSITLLFGFAFIGAISWAKLGLTPGNWAGLESLPGNPFITLSQHSGVLLILTSVIAVASPFMTGFVFLGSGSRVTFAMSKLGILSKKLSAVHENFRIPHISLVISAIIAAIIVLVSAPVPTIYGLLTDSVVAGYLGYSIIPFSMLNARKRGSPMERRITKGKISGYVIAYLAFISASLIVFWSGWPADPYAVLVLTIGVVVFSVMYKVNENFRNAGWFIGYIAFMVVMSYIGSVGAKSFLPFADATAVVVAVASFVFFPLGIYFGISEETKESRDLSNWAEPEV